ncbi:MAG: M20/M25/M40 family metallo-hydrolase, partial [Bacteroidales bacterium]|nr:M20/M25/M40 family metallo-hydrolase [Bacteroidales bacterium]
MHHSNRSNCSICNCILIKSIISFFVALLFFFQTYQTKAQEVYDFTTSSAIQFLSEYIRIPSVSGNENQAAYFLMQACEEKGLYIYKISDTIGSVNFAASLYPLNLNKPNIVFHNHMDVVPAGDSCQWTYAPYSGTIANGKVWGRGSMDNKGLAIIQLFTIEKFIGLAINKDLPYNVTIVCVSGEETGGFTGSAIVSENFKEIFNPVVVIGEGGAGMDNIAFLDKAKIFFGISITEKSSVWLKLSYNVQSAGHASIAGSDYAYKRLIKSLHKLIDKQQPIQITNEVKLMFTEAGKSIGGIKGFAFKNLDWKIFRPTIKKYVKNVPEFESMLCNTITVSSFGEIYNTTNQTPMEVHATLDCRLLPG